MFIDVHCHLDTLSELEESINKARKYNVGIIITQGTEKNSNRNSLKLSELYKEVKCALGLYPIKALEMKEKEIEEEIKFIKNNKERIVAVGEVGLDFKEDKEQFTKQHRVFEQIIELAKEINKPLIVHSRKAELQCISQLENLGARKVIMHCFSGKMSLVKRIINNKWYISIPTSVKNSEHFKKIVEITPIEQLFCETDSPYLHPDKLFPNEPANIIVSYEIISKIKGLKLKDIENNIEENYKRLFC